MTDTGKLDLTLLVEQYKKDIWQYKMRESEWEKTKNQLEGHKKIVSELSTKIVDLNNRLQSALDINDDHQKYNGKLQTRLTEVERDNKKLAEEVASRIDHLRKAGF